MAQLRNYTVGTVILTAVLIICLPVFFSDVPATEIKYLAIPHRPSVPSPYQFNSELSDTSYPFKNLIKLPLSPGTAWVLQVADFKQSLDANLLIQSLRQKGFRAYTRQIMLPRGLVTRVFVGPEIKSEQIKILETRLSKEMQLKSVVAAFDPLRL